MPEGIELPQSVINQQAVSQEKIDKVDSEDPSEENNAPQPPTAEAASPSEPIDAMDTSDPAEALQNLEAVKERQKVETARITQNVLMRRANEIDAKRVNGESLSPAEDKLTQSMALESDDASFDEPIPLDKGNPLNVTLADGTSGRVMEITGREANGDYKGKIDVDGVLVDKIIPSNTFLQAQLLSEKDNIRQALSAEDQQLFDLYMNTVTTGESTLEGKTTEEIDTILKNAAENSGMLMTDAFRDFAMSNLSDLSSETVLALQQMEGNIVDVDTAVTFFSSIGASPEQFQKLSADLEAKRNQLQAIIDRSPNADNTNTRAELDSLNAQLELNNQIKLGLADNDSLKGYFQAMENGTLKADAGKKLNQALRSKNPEEVKNVFYECIKYEPTDDELQRQEKDKKRKQMQALALNTGIGLAIAVVLVASAVSESGKSLK